MGWSDIGVYRNNFYETPNIDALAENRPIQLFNLHDDPGEQINLVKREPEKAKSLLAELHAWRKRIGAAMPIQR